MIIGIQNSSFTEKDLESSNWNPESTVVLDSRTWCDSSVLVKTGTLKSSGMHPWISLALLTNCKQCWHSGLQHCFIFKRIRNDETHH